MKCPKCGYNSFEFLDACKKCGSELGSLKKTYRINPVMFCPGDGAMNEESQGAIAGSAEGLAAGFAGPDADNAGGGFSWDAPDSSTVGQRDEVYSGFDLSFPDATKHVEPEGQESGFSFDDEPTAPASDHSTTMNESSSREYTFSDKAEGAQNDFQWDTGTGTDVSEIDAYERMLEPESLQQTAASAVEGNADGIEEPGTIGVPDFSFDSDSDSVKMETAAGEQTVSATTEKKPQPNLEDFEKEFENIFAIDESTEK